MEGFVFWGAGEDGPGRRRAHGTRCTHAPESRPLAHLLLLRTAVLSEMSVADDASIRLNAEALGVMLGTGVPGEDGRSSATTVLAARLWESLGGWPGTAPSTLRRRALSACVYWVGTSPIACAVARCTRCAKCSGSSSCCRVCCFPEGFRDAGRGARRDRP